MSRTDFLRLFGAVQTNAHWSWAAVNHLEKVCYFSAWLDHMHRDKHGAEYYIIQQPWWGKNHRYNAAGRKDQDKILDLVFYRRYQYNARIYKIEAVDTDAQPRQIKRVLTDAVWDVRMTCEPGQIRAYPIKRVAA